ncbi:MAG: enoyl-CoA hydratase/isomerase family protein [Caldilineales bacterium]|nr:enoyl-CoA hydratase/isomerase family protein [Caldilineales bacterium]MDW8316730.1 enoyl-CoA hydratase/isomerase family protein [Anaerolineae bacterium]
MTAPSPLVLAERREDALVVTLNRPDKLNALSLEMMDALDAALEPAADPAVRCVLLHGAGRCFSAGIDLTSLLQAGITALDGPQFRRLVARLQGVFNRLEALEKPVIALLHGYCFGMGLELVLAADFRIAAEDTVLAIQEVEIGLIPDVGGTTRLVRTVGIPHAKELIMLARRVDARRAYEIGLVHEVAPAGDLLSRGLAWAAELRRCAPLAVGLAKKVIDRGAHLDKLTLMELEALAQSTLIGTADVQEGIRAKLERRPPAFQGR